MSNIFKEINKLKIQRDIYYLQGHHNLASEVMQKILDIKRLMAEEYELDKLGVRYLREFSLALGHIGLLDTYVKMSVLNKRSNKTPIILADRVSNMHYLNYWRQYIPNIITNKDTIKSLNNIAPFIEDHVFFIDDKMTNDYTSTDLHTLIQMQWDKENRPPLLKLNEHDIQRGYERLYVMALRDVDWFVGIHCRDDYDSNRGVRSTNIEDYFKAIESITKLGGYVVRMGDKTMKPLPKMYHVIDYATSDYKEDWMDVFLFGACKFFICTQSGPGNIPSTYGIPVVATNWNYAWRRWFKDDLFIMKKLCRGDNILSMEECLSSNYGNAEDLGYLKCEGITVIPNTPDEINDVVSEMLDKVLGSKQDDYPEFEYIWNDYRCKSNSHIGKSYLENNASWILKKS